MTGVLESPIRSEATPQGSDRGFGFVFAVVFVLIALWPLWSLNSPRWWALGIAGGLTVVALAWPRLLYPFNRLWLALGNVLHRIMSPLIMGTIFFITVAPTGWLLRLCGKDVLALRLRPDLETYWVTREEVQPASETMKRQF